MTRKQRHGRLLFTVPPARHSFFITSTKDLASSKPVIEHGTSFNPVHLLSSTKPTPSIPLSCCRVNTRHVADLSQTCGKRIVFHAGPNLPTPVGRRRDSGRCVVRDPFDKTVPINPFPRFARPSSKKSKITDTTYSGGIAHLLKPTYIFTSMIRTRGYVFSAGSPNSC